MSSSTHSFKKHIFRTCNVTLLLVSIITTIYIFIIYPQSPEQYRYKHCTNNYTILFYGDSHTDAAINPEHIQNSCNLAIPGENYYTILYKTKQIKNKTIIIQHSLRLLTTPIDDTGFRNTRLILHYKPYMTPPQINKLYDNLNLFETTTLSIIPVIGSAPYIQNILKKRSMKLYAASIDNTQVLVNTSLDIEIRTKLYTNQTIIQQNNQLLQQIIKQAHKNNNKVIIIIYPIHPELQEIIKKPEPIENITYWDFYQTIPQTRFYYDTEHLNRLGANLLSKKINEVLTQ